MRASHLRLSALPALLTITLCLSGPAQQTTAVPPVTGMVTGHVVCSDTRKPARMASVLLIPITDLTAPEPKPDANGMRPQQITTAVQTLLDGSFTIAGVHPGDYYALAEELGYLSPLAQLSRDELGHPSKETAALMATLLTPIRVAANRTATADVTLYKGASIAGSVRFDDGTPVTNTSIKVLRKGKNGTWEEYRSRMLAIPFGSSRTNDQGSFRVAGLPSGEYLVEVALEINDVMVSQLFQDAGSTAFNQRYTLTVYSGDTMRQRDAKPIHLTEAEEVDGSVIEVPLSRLHTISGTVVASGSGQGINSAKMELRYSDDPVVLVSTPIRKEDGQFHFLYVPEGEFTLKATKVRDVTREEVSNGQYVMPPTHTVEKTIRAYEDAEQPLLVHTDMSGVTISASEKAAAAKP